MMESAPAPEAPAKILRLIARLNIGGPAKHVSWLTARLDPRRYTTVLAAGRVEGNEEDMGYFARELGVTPVLLRNVRRSLGPFDLAGLREVYALLRREQPALLHTHASKAGFLGRTAALLINCARRLAGRPRLRVVHTFHGHTFHSYHGPLLNRAILAVERFLARFATDAIVVISPNQQDEINRVFRIGRPDQFRIVPLGLDLDPYAEIRRYRGRFRALFNLPPDALVVGIVGRLTAVKNHLRFLEIAARLRREHGDLCARHQLRFAIIGDGELRDALEARARELNLFPAVVFTGNIRNQFDYLADLEILALTSDNEGTPLTIIEAMACGIPVIATDVGGVRDLLGRDERGLLVGKTDVAGFAGQLAALVGDPARRQALAEKGLQYVRVNHSLERLVGDLDRLYQELLTAKD